MARFIQPAKIPGGGATSPHLQQLAYTTGQTFKKGAVLVYVAAGTVSEAGADPVLNIAGIASEPAGSHPGYEPANASQVLQVTGISQEVGVYIANSETIFSSRATSVAGGDPTTPTQTLINEEYGLVKDANGIWLVDLDEVTAKSIRIIDFDADLKMVFWRFLPAVFALA